MAIMWLPRPQASPSIINIIIIWRPTSHVTRTMSHKQTKEHAWRVPMNELAVSPKIQIRAKSTIGDRFSNTIIFVKTADSFSQ